MIDVNLTNFVTIGLMALVFIAVTRMIGSMLNVQVPGT